MALKDLRDLPLRRAPHPSLLQRCRGPHDNLTSDEAAYVALAVALIRHPNRP